MKKVACFLPLLLCILCLTGCIRFNTTVTVKSNGKADISMLYASIDSSSYSGTEDKAATNELKPELRQKYTDDGWVVEDYSEDGYTGHILSINDVDLIELSARLKETNELVASDNNSKEKKDENSGFSLERDGLKYKINWQVFDKTDNISEAAPYIKASKGYMKFTLNLPVKPDSSNATKVLNDGKTLEWDLLELGDDGNIEVTFSLISVPLIITIVVVVLVMIAAVVVTIVFLTKKKQKVPVEQPTTEEL